MAECPCSNCARVRSTTGSVPAHGLGIGDELAFGIFRASVLHPRSFADKGGNDDSLVLVLDAYPAGEGDARARFLFAGDAEKEVLQPIAGEGALGTVDVVKVGHHGSSGALSDFILDQLDPELALISAGEGNPYGHPNQETVDLLEEHGVAIARTDLLGDVVCEITASGIKVKSFG